MNNYERQRLIRLENQLMKDAPPMLVEMFQHAKNDLPEEMLPSIISDFQTLKEDWTDKPYDGLINLPITHICSFKRQGWLNRVKKYFRGEC
jgi:hypothetical protein